jgi:hypothetical protein
VPRIARVAALALTAAPLVVPAASPAGTQPVTAPEIAHALRLATVYTDPAAKPTLTLAQAERVRLRIVQRAPGRIAIAVVSHTVAARAGGVRRLAQAIDRGFDVNGALLVIDSEDDSAWVIVSYPETERAVRAVREAFAGGGSFSAHTLEAVDRLAAADPGPGRSSGGPATSTGPVTTTPDVATDVDDAVRTVFIVVGVLLAIPLLVVVLLVVRRSLRGRRDSEPAEGFALTPPTAPSNYDAQRSDAEKAFGSEDR